MNVDRVAGNGSRPLPLAWETGLCLLMSRQASRPFLLSPGHGNQSHGGVSEGAFSADGSAKMRGGAAEESAGG